MREIVLDTETTGLDPADGHRIVEIGCVELINHVPTARPGLQLYINPQRDMPEEAFNVHGLSSEFLSDKPIFAQVVDQFLEFIGDDANLVIHNARFDMKFINAELAALDRPAIPMDRAVDTLALARQKYPGSPVTLDALCRRFNIDLAKREKHGALLDSELLAEVYLELMGGRQHGFSLAGQGGGADAARQQESHSLDAPREIRPPRPHAASADELAAHEQFLGKISDPIWSRDS